MMTEKFWEQALVNVVAGDLNIKDKKRLEFESCWRGEGHLLFEDTFDCRAQETKRLEEKFAVSPAAFRLL